MCASWGPDDDGRTVDGPHLLAAVSELIVPLSLLAAHCGGVSVQGETGCGCA